MSDSYDSREETNAHIDRVDALLIEVGNVLSRRAEQHDSTKLRTPEKEIFDAVTGKLKGMTYGSDEYKASLAEMGPALDHHYAANRHHPEHHENGVCDMTLIDLIEMLADWKAAGERHADGSLVRSLEINEARFKIPECLIGIMKKTAEELGWV